MSASSLGLFFIVVFITCVTPGAGVLYTLKNAINYGKNNAFLSPTGNAIGVLFMSILAASGLGAVIHESSVMFSTACSYADACFSFGSAGKAGRLRLFRFLHPSNLLIQRS